MVRSDDEQGCVASDLLILRDRDRDFLRAVRITALAEDLKLRFVRDGLWILAYLADSFVRLPKERLVQSDRSRSLVSHNTATASVVRLLHDLIRPKRVDDPLAVGPWVAGDDKKEIRLLGNVLPLRKADLHAPSALLIRALAEEGHRLVLRKTALDDVVQALVRSLEGSLVFLAAFIARCHGETLLARRRAETRAEEASRRVKPLWPLAIPRRKQTATPQPR